MNYTGITAIIEQYKKKRKRNEENINKKKVKQNPYPQNQPTFAF
jgi:hypothetical protein